MQSLCLDVVKLVEVENILEPDDDENEEAGEE